MYVHSTRQSCLGFDTITSNYTIYLSAQVFPTYSQRAAIRIMSGKFQQSSYMTDVHR